MNLIVMNELNAHHEAMQKQYGAENVFVTMLYGSQNYQLDTPESDVDTKCIVLPNFREFCLNQKLTSTEHTVAGGIVNAKDVRAMFTNFLKSNINFLECLFTDYYVVTPGYEGAWLKLRKIAPVVANAQPRKLIHAAAGMAKQKFHALEKPFESKAEVLAKYAYDPKQLHHLVRLRSFIGDYLDCEDFESCLVPSQSDHEYLMSLKVDPVSQDEAKTLAQSSMEAVDRYVLWADRRYAEVSPQYHRVKHSLEDLSVLMLQEHFAKELNSSAYNLGMEYAEGATYAREP